MDRSELPRGTIVVSLIMIATLLGAISLTGYWCEYVAGISTGKLLRVFALDEEANISTWFASTILLLSALLMLWIAAKDREKRCWTLLAIIFIGLSADESARLHEGFIYPMRDRFALTGYFYFGWVIPGMAFVLAIGLVFSRFLLRVPIATRIGLLAAACLYVGGALGAEMISGHVASGIGQENFRYHLVTHIEEMLEMLGVIALIHTLLVHPDPRLVAACPARVGADRGRFLQPASVEFAGAPAAQDHAGVLHR